MPLPRPPRDRGCGRTVFDSISAARFARIGNFFRPSADDSGASGEGIFGDWVGDRQRICATGNGRKGWRDARVGTSSCIGTSAGGVDALSAAGRPASRPGFPASVFVVSHFPPGGRSGPARHPQHGAGPLPATHATDGEVLSSPATSTPRPRPATCCSPPTAGPRLTRGRAERTTTGRRLDPLFRSAAGITSARADRGGS